MDVRFLARGLRARPSPSLLSSRQQPRTLQPILPSTQRYNSSKPSSQTSSTESSTKSTTQPPASETPTPQTTEQTTPDSKGTKGRVSDFDEILNNLDLGKRTQTKPQIVTNINNRRRVFSDSGSVSRAVTDGVGQQAWREQAAQLANRKTELKLGPTLGRQVHVEPERGVDLAAAIRNLQITVNANKIKQQYHEQKFHMRKGAVRKQLRRTRWRKLFQFSFQETVKKIQRMQAQGW